MEYGYTILRTALVSDQAKSMIGLVSYLSNS